MRRTRARRTRPGLVPRAAPHGYADHLGTDAPRKPRRTPTPTPHTHSPVSGALFGIAASTLFGKCLTVKNVRCTGDRLSNITVYSFHTLSTFLTVKNVTFTWYRLSNITVYSFLTLMTFLFFLIRISWLSLHTFTHSKSFKFLLARKSWFSFPNITESKSTFFILGPRKTRLLSTVEALTTSRVPTYFALIGVNVIRTTIRYNLLLYAYKTSKG